MWHLSSKKKTRYPEYHNFLLGWGLIDSTCSLHDYAYLFDVPHVYILLDVLVHHVVLDVVHCTRANVMRNVNHTNVNRLEMIWNLIEAPEIWFEHGTLPRALIIKLQQNTEVSQDGFPCQAVRRACGHFPCRLCTSRWDTTFEWSTLMITSTPHPRRNLTFLVCANTRVCVMTWSQLELELCRVASYMALSLINFMTASS